MFMIAILLSPAMAAETITTTDAEVVAAVRKHVQRDDVDVSKCLTRPEAFKEVVVVGAWTEGRGCEPWLWLQNGEVQDDVCKLTTFVLGKDVSPRRYRTWVVEVVLGADGIEAGADAPTDFRAATPYHPPEVVRGAQGQLELSGWSLERVTVPGTAPHWTHVTVTYDPNTSTCSTLR